MIRTQIYLTEKERDELARLARDSGRTQSDLIREAIDSFLGQRDADQRRKVLKRLAGLWRKRTDLPDFTELRAEWDRTGSR